MATKKLAPYLTEQSPSLNWAAGDAFLASLSEQKEPEKPKSRTVVQAANDYVVEGVNALAGSVSAAGNFVSPGNRVSKFIDKNLIEAGQETQSELVQGVKAKYAADMASADSASEEVAITLRFAAENPGLVASQAIGSFVGPGLAIKGAMKGAQALGLGARGAARTGLAAGSATGGAMAGGDAAGTAYDLVKQAGGTDAEAEAAARQASVIPAAVGAAGGLVGAERVFSGVGRAAGGVRGALRTGAVEAGQEAIEEGITNYEGRRAAVPYDESIDPMKGTAGAAAMGAVLGGATGAGVHAISPGDQVRAAKLADTGPMSRAANAGIEQDAAMVDAGVPLPVDPAQAEAQQAEQQAMVEAEKVAAQEQQAADDEAVARTPIFDAGINDIRQELTQPGAMDALRARFGEEGARLFLNSLNQAQNPKATASVRQKHLEAVERGMFALRTTREETQVEQPNLEGAPAPLQLEADPAPLAIELDTAPTGTLRVDGEGNAAPETRAEAISTQAAAAEAEALGLGTGVPRGAQEEVVAAPAPAVEPAPVVAPEPVAAPAPVEAPVVQPAPAAELGPAAQPAPSAEAQAAPAPATRDILNPIGEPFRTKMAANRAAKAQGGEVRPVEGGFVVRTPLAEATAPAPAPAAAPAAVGGPRVIGRVGKAPGAAVPVELRTNDDGTLTPWSEGYEMLDFDSGDPIRIPAGSTDQEAVAAIKAAGALSSRDRVYPARPGAAAKGAFSRSPSVTKISGTEVGGTMPTVDLRRAATAYAERELIGKTFTNGPSGTEIRVTRQGIKHGLAGANEFEIRLLPALPGLLEKARLVQTSRDKQNRPDVKSVQLYAGSVEVGGSVAEVGVVVRELTDGHRYYDHFVLKEMPPSGTSEAASALQKLDVQPTQGGGAIVGEKTSAGQSGEQGAPDSVRPFAEKGSPDERGEGLDSSPSTRPTPTPTRREPGAGDAESVERVQTLVDAIAARWTNAPKIVVVESINDPKVPSALRDADDAQLSQGAEGAPKGAWHDGSVYLFADQLPGDMQALNVLSHEALGHYGLRGFFGEQLSGILDRMARLNGAAVRAKAAEYGLDMTDADQRRLAAEEVLADMASRNPQIGWVKQAIAAIRTWLRERVPGFGRMRYTDAELIRNFIEPARAFVQRGAPKAGDFSDTAPAVRQVDAAAGGVFSRGEALPDWISEGSDALKLAASKVDTYAPRKTLAEKVEGLTQGWRERVVQKVFDSYAPLKNLSYDAYIAARMTKGADGALEGLLLHGKPIMEEDGSLRGDLDGRGFLGAMRELQGEHDRFLMWMAGNRAKRLAEEGRENLFSADEIDAMMKLNVGAMPDGSSRPVAYRNATQSYASYNKAVLDIAERAGLVDGESRHLWEHEMYVPFYRVNADDTTAAPARVKGLVRQKAFDKLKGGTEPLGDLMQNTLENWSRLLSSSLSNIAARKSLLAAADVGVAVEAREETAREIAKATGTRGGATFFMDQGEQRWFTVGDPMVLEAITAMESSGLNGWPTKLLGNFKRWLTVGTTISPAFKIRNLIRDTLAAPAANEMSFDISKNLAQGWRATDKKSEAYQQMLFSGALMRFGTYLEGDRAAHVKKLIAAGVNANTILDTPEKVRTAASRWWDSYQDFGDRLENVNRAALYEQLIAKGVSQREAAFQARDMMDFSLQGSSVAVRFLTSTVPFLNARAQGLYKLGRAGLENPKRLGYVVGAVALASIALMLANADDPDWKAREDWDRDAFWWVKIGGTAYRIPKPFEVGALGTIAERSVELLISDEMSGARFADRMKHLVSDTFSVNPIPQALKPMVDIYANKDSFTGREIESQGMENHSKSERYGPNTSTVARALGLAGDVTGFSPVQVDFMIKSYFGWLGTFATGAVDVMARPLEERERPAMRIADVFSGFVREMPDERSRYVTTFYEQLKKSNELMADIKRARETGDQEKAQRLADDEPELVAGHKQLTRTQRQLSKINAQMREIRQGPLSGQEKRERLRELALRRNELATRTMSGTRVGA